VLPGDPKSERVEAMIEGEDSAELTAAVGVRRARSRVGEEGVDAELGVGVGAVIRVRLSCADGEAVEVVGTTAAGMRVAAGGRNAG
jgi:hypothetical protein